MKTKIELVTSEIAIELLKSNTRNRPMKQRLVLDYARQMRDGLWKENGEPIIISDGNVLLDGQHRLAAIVKSNTSHNILIVSGVNGDVFDTIDTGKTRSGSDVLATSGVKHYSLISAGVLNYMIFKRGLSIISGNGASVRDYKVSKQEILSEYNTASGLYDQIAKESIRLSSKLRIMKGSVIFGYMAYLIKCKNHNQAKVESFFQQLFLNENVENTTTLALREKLIKNAISQYKMTPYLFAGYFTKTWNAFVSGKEYKILTFNVEGEKMQELI